MDALSLSRGFSRPAAPVASTSDESDVSLLARIRRFVAPRAETTPYVAMDASRRDVELTPVPISP